MSYNIFRRDADRARLPLPGYHARRGNADKAKRSLRRLYGNVPSYDVEREYDQMASTIEVERRDHGGSWWTEYRDCFVGING